MCQFKMGLEKMLAIVVENHFETLMKTLNDFSQSNILSDFSIISGSQHLSVHRHVLSSVTTYFEDLLEDRAVTSCCFIFDDLHENMYEKLVELIYNGTAVVEKKKAHVFRKLLTQLNLNTFQVTASSKRNQEVISFKNYRETFINALWLSRSALRTNYMIFVTNDWSETTAHAVVMCSWSKNLQLLMSHTGKHKLVLDNVCKVHLDTVIEFCYKGEVSVDEDMLFDVYKVAHLLGVDTLCELICCSNPLLQFPRNEKPSDVISKIKTHGNAKLNEIGARRLFSNLIEYEHLVDISIVSESISHSAHLGVLSEFSSKFQCLIKNVKTIKDSTLLVQDLDHKQVQSFIEYVYKGETEFHGSVKDFCSVMKNWIDFDSLPICEAQERQLLSKKVISGASFTTPPEIQLMVTSSDPSTSVASRMASSVSASTGSLSTNKSAEHVGFPDIHCKEEEAAEDEFQDEIIEDDDQLQSKSPRSPRVISRVCNTCGLDMKTQQAFRQHLAVHPDARIVKCSFCGKRFNRPSQLALHERIHTGLRPYQCEVCGRGFSAKGSMCKHLATHRAEKYVCDVCNKGFSRKEYMEEHLRTHSGKKPYTCEVCQKTFVGRTGLNHHQKTHDGKKEAVCEICGKSFTRHGLWTHVKSHNKTFKCSTCNKTFSTSTSLRIHNLGTHIGQKGHQCHTCGKSFFQKNHLIRHMTVHSEGHKPYKCHKCPKAYTSDMKLQMHIENDHFAPGCLRYSCNHCDRKFAGRSSLIYHERIHTGERPHSCSVCGKTFMRPDNMRTHLLTHQKQPQVHLCPVCQMSFVSKKALKNHHDSVHVEPKDQLDTIPDSESANKCSICHKIFKSENKLLAHTKSNHTMKKFHCGLCSKYFRCEANLAKHRLKIHAISLPASADLPPTYSFQVCESNYETVLQFSPNVNLQPIRRPFSINIEGNLCCNTDDSDMIVAPNMIANVEHHVASDVTDIDVPEETNTATIIGVTINSLLVHEDDT